MRHCPKSLHTNLGFFFLLFASVSLEPSPGALLLHFLSSRQTYSCPVKWTASPSSYSNPGIQMSGQSVSICGQGPRGSHAFTESEFDRSPGSFDISWHFFLSLQKYNTPSRVTSSSLSYKKEIAGFQRLGQSPIGD